jgi:hypothetical protein
MIHYLFNIECSDYKTKSERIGTHIGTPNVLIYWMVTLMFRLSDYFSIFTRKKIYIIICNIAYSIKKYYIYIHVYISEKNRNNRNTFVNLLTPNGYVFRSQKQEKQQKRSDCRNLFKIKHLNVPFTKKQQSELF